MASTHDKMLELSFENPFMNPYESDIPSYSPTIERYSSASSTKHSPYAEKEEWDVKDVYTEKRKYAQEYEQATMEPALLFRNLTAQDAVRSLSFQHPGHGRKHLIVKDDGGKTVYYADVSRWTSAPDIALHTGETKDHPVVAIARFRHARHLRLGLGDSADEPAMAWEEMKNMKWLSHSLYRFEITGKEPGGSGERRALVFQRTRAKEDGVANRLSSMNFRLADETTGEVLALYLTTGLVARKKRGTLHIKSGFVAGNVEVLAVLGLCGLIEKKWRRDQRNSGG